MLTTTHTPAAMTSLLQLAYFEKLCNACGGGRREAGVQNVSAPYRRHPSN